MKTVAAKDAKNRFGELLDTARREPVTIEKNGRPVAVVLSSEEYERLESLETAYWLKRAEAAEKAGYVGAEKSERLLRNLMRAED